MLTKLIITLVIIQCIQLKFLPDVYTDYPRQFIEGYMKALNLTETYPSVLHCLDSKMGIEDKLTVVLKDIAEFYGDNRNLANMINIAYSVGSLVFSVNDKIKLCFRDTHGDVLVLGNNFERRLQNLPSNFKAMYRNTISNKQKLELILKEIKDHSKDGNKTGQLFGELVSIILESANDQDESLESYSEFKMFDDCFTSIIYGTRVDMKSFKGIAQYMIGKEDLRTTIQELMLLFEEKRDQIDYCWKFYKNLINTY